MAAFPGTWRVRFLNWKKAWKEWMGQVGLPCHLLGHIIRYTEDEQCRRPFVNGDPLGCK